MAAANGSPVNLRGATAWPGGGEPRPCSPVSAPFLQTTHASTFREPEAIAAPLRVVLDRQARLPLDARLLATQGPVLLMHGVDAFPKRLDALRAHGVTCHSLPSNPDEQLHAVLHHLAEQEINELHIEAGAQLSGAWLASGLVDELLVYLAPKLIGPGRPLLELPPLHSLADASSWRWIDSQAFGADLRLRLRPST
jgi:diaminohydroxyphosphoribosylaminopyrimidine deaminase/5-amino-6-(5-phosphoribosylamino)uracil reductase